MLRSKVYILTVPMKITKICKIIISLKGGFCNLLIDMSNDFKEQVGWLDYTFYPLKNILIS